MVTFNKSPEAGNTRALVISLVVGGIITLAVGILLGATVSAALYLIAIASVFDFGLAWAYHSGRLDSRLGPTAQRRRRDAETSGDAGSIAESDPSYNPYARED